LALSGSFASASIPPIKSRLFCYDGLAPLETEESPMPEELQRQSIASSFEHELVNCEPHYFIKSKCKRCGASEEALSIYDGSLEKWEDEHECQKRPYAATLALLGRFRSWLAL